MEGPMKWFDNPRKRRSGSRKGRRRKGKRRPPKGGWKKYMARLRAMKKRKHSGGTMARRRKRRRRASNRRRHRVRGHSMRRGSRRIRVRAHLSNPRRRRYRRRHNPPRFSLGGVINRAKAGAVDAVWIVGGKAVTNIIPSLLGLAPTGALGLAIKAPSARAAGEAFGVVSANAGKLATAARFAP